MTRLSVLRVFSCLLLPLLVTTAQPSSAQAFGTSDEWSWPLLPRPPVMRGFDPPADPWGAGHRGVDLAGTPGQAVLAVAPGTVSFAGLVADVGVVVVQHGAVRSTYQPVVPQVRVGQQVDTGALLGALATPGSHCLPAACLHLGARRGDTYLDPLRLLADVPVRLKPWAGLPESSWTGVWRPVQSGAGVGLSIGGA